jgi:hypothetical protein
VAAYCAADATDRRGLLTYPFDVARPELSRQTTPSSRAVALEQTLTGFRHTLAELAGFALPDDQVPRSAANNNSGKGSVRRRERVGGLLSYYYQKAA